MGVEKQFRPLLTRGEQTWDTEALGSTSGDIAQYGLTVITATATGLVYQLQAPKLGDMKTISVAYTGATGNLTIANASTGTVFGGSTNNTMTVSSSADLTRIDLIGISTAAWQANWAAVPTTAVWKVAYAASTVTS